MDDIRDKFRSEALDHLQKAEGLIQSYATDPSTPGHLSEANRHFHALKGSSPLVGARPVSEVARTVEACLKRVVSQPALFTSALHATLKFAIKQMERQIEDFITGQPIRDGESVIRTIRSYLPTTQSVADLLQDLDLISRELRNSLGETVQGILGRELDDGKRLYVLHVPPHKEMQSELPHIKSALKGYGSILSVAGREEGSIHILISSPHPVEVLREQLKGLQAVLSELLSRGTATEPSPAHDASAMKATTGIKEGKKYRILFSDDSEITRDIYRILLERNGYEVEVAKDGAEALQMLRASSFDAVVTDDQMPAMDGTEFLQVAKSDDRLYRVPFIIISAHASSEARKSALANGAAAYLVKGSFEKEQFLVLLREAIDKAQ